MVVKKKKPAKWADFTRDGTVTVEKKEHIETLMNSPYYGKDFKKAPKVVQKEKKTSTVEMLS